MPAIILFAVPRNGPNGSRARLALATLQPPSPPSMPTKPSLHIRHDPIARKPTAHLPDHVHIHRNLQVWVRADHE